LFPRYKNKYVYESTEVVLTNPNITVEGAKVKIQGAKNNHTKENTSTEVKSTMH
jgi:hypothetical protein